MTPWKLEELARAWRRRTVLRDLLFALAAGCVVAALCFPWKATLSGWPLIAFASVLAVRLWMTQPWLFNGKQLARHLNRAHAELEESSGLWLRAPESLSVIERLQRRRVDAALARWSADDSRPRFGMPPPGFLWPAAVLSILAVIGLAGVILWTAITHRLRRDFVRPPVAVSGESSSVRATPPGQMHVPRVTGVELTIVPPTYTGRPTRHGTELNVEVEEGAFVTWSLMLDAPVRDARIVFGQEKGEVLALNADSSGAYEARQDARDSSLYHLAATLPDGIVWNPPEVYSLKVVKDLPPVITIVQPEVPRTEITPPAPGDAPHATVLPVEVSVTDDYAVASARIVATVAKGSGEAVKFREQSIEFEEEKPNKEQGPNPRSRHFVKTLDLAALGLEPGDELYFHIEAVDNRVPTANRARSETRFVVLKGPETKAISSGRGVAGINLIPQYFRSERQIIIDAEKLISVRPTLNDADFRQRSNDLGIDQQLLRLRYGQFLGEELEQGQGSGDHNEVNLDPLLSGVPKDLIHQHDATAGGGVESNDPHAAARTALRLRLEHAAQAAGQGDGPESAAPPSGTGVPPTADQVIAPFVDQHDSQDKATLFDQEEKGTMRDALAAMWEAEGYLRTTRPQEALAPANRALTILKTIQQSARAYVQHVGFEPPPLQVDARRLNGDASEVPARPSIKERPWPDNQTVAAVRRALQEFPWAARASVPTPEQVAALLRAEPALTDAGTRQPDTYLAPLQTLRMLSMRRQPVKAEEAIALERALLRLLPPVTPRPVRPEDPAPELAAPYFQILDKLEKNP